MHNFACTAEIATKVTPVILSYLPCIIMYGRMHSSLVKYASNVLCLLTGVNAVNTKKECVTEYPCDYQMCTGMFGFTDDIFSTFIFDIRIMAHTTLCSFRWKFHGD